MTPIDSTLTQTTPALAVSAADISAAAQRISATAYRTPVLTSKTANDMSGAQLFFKAENFQRMGAFKFRGAANAIARFNDQQRKGGVIAFSSGNHAQAIALSAKLAGIKACIVMPNDAPANKLAATRGYGAEVVLYDRYTQDREAICQALARERGMTMIPPYDHADVIAGQGTAAKELIEQVGQLDYLLVCLGGGGLLSGCAIAAHEWSPGVRVIGVEPEAGNDVQQSFAAGKIIKIETPKTIADGAQTQAAGILTFPIIQKTVESIQTASDSELVATMKFFAQTMKIVVEPTGCLAAAVALRAPDYTAGPSALSTQLAGKRVGVIISGGNTDLTQYAQWIGA
jgi:threo-3-hydroxy-L-aspartate ammonia-lyase